MENQNFDALKLENQLCFPLYAASREVIKLYYPLLEADLGITYTQYIAMMAFWEYKKLNVKELGKILYLDSGTLTPVLKALEQKGYVCRKRSKIDERYLDVEITSEGEKLKERAIKVPEKMMTCVNLDPTEAKELYRLLYKLLAHLKESKA